MPELKLSLWKDQKLYKRLEYSCQNADGLQRIHIVVIG